jgi:hypothetical protein
MQRAMHEPPDSVHPQFTHHKSEADSDHAPGPFVLCSVTCSAALGDG